MNKVYQVLTRTLTLLIISSFAAYSQGSHAVVRDTSFNIPATLAKEQKRRPYITVASSTIPGHVSIKRDVMYRSLNGRELLLDVCYPRKIRRRKPAVLLVYGGGWRSGEKSHNQAMAIRLAEHGYVAASPEYRLSPEATYPAAVYDLKAAIRWMRAHASVYGIDTDRIAVLGCSAGGQLAALIGTTNGIGSFEDSAGYPEQSSTIQAVIDIDGTLAFHHPESSEGAVAAQWLGGTYEQKPRIWMEAAPLEHVSRKTPPMLFINSSIARFHAGRDDMVRKLDSLNIYSEVHTIGDTPHPFWFFNPWFEPMMEFVIGFLNRQFSK